MKISIIAKRIFDFLTISKIEPFSWTCSVGCSHTSKRTHYRWYWKLSRQWYYDIRRLLRIDKNFLPRVSRVFPCLYNAEQITKIPPMSAPVGLHYYLRYQIDDKDNKQL